MATERKPPPDPSITRRLGDATEGSRELELKAQGYAPGRYYCICGECKKQHEADKRAWRCVDCARIAALRARSAG